MVTEVNDLGPTEFLPAEPHMDFIERLDQGDKGDAGSSQGGFHRGMGMDVGVDTVVSKV
jgi:hypothetical protein